MKNINNQNYWEYFLGFISEEFDSGVFDLIIKMNIFKSFENGVFTVISPTKTVQQLINSQFKNKLEAFMSADSGQKVEINAILNSENHKLSTNNNNERPIKIVESSTIQQNNHYSVLEIISNKFLDQMKPEKKYFNDFVVGKSNEIAFKASVEFTKSEKNNILFLYGDSGLGKSHLLSSVGNEYIKNNKKVAHMKAVEFVEYYTSSLGHISSAKNTFGSVDEFVKVLNTVDLLIIDDVQGFVGKTGSADTFFNIFEYLFKQGKKIAIASDAPPNSLDGIPERLKTRFSYGGTIKLSKPETELSKKYLEKEFKLEFSDNPDLIVTNDVYDTLIYNFGGDFRSLKGVVTKISYAMITDPKNIIDLNYITKNVLNDPITKGKIKGSSIQKKVCEKYMIENSQLIGKSRKKEVKDARHLAIYLYRKRLDLSYKQIGHVFNNRDHSTVMHSEKSVVKKIEQNETFANFVSQIEKEIFG